MSLKLSFKIDLKDSIPKQEIVDDLRLVLFQVNYTQYCKMGDKEDYLTSYRVFFENFAATVDPEDQLPVNIAGYTITEAELPGEVIYWTTQYLSEK